MLIYNHEGDIGTFLQDVHDEILKRYLKGIYNKKGNISTYAQNAKELQNFFMELKSQSTKQSNEQNETLKMVIEETNSILGKRKNTQLFTHSYDSKNNIDPFEKEMNAVLFAITKNVALKEDADKLTIENFSVGGKNVNVNLPEKFFKKWIEEALIESAEIAQQELTYQDKWGESLARQGKPDSQGVQVRIKVNANPKLLKIYNLIKNAKFSDKNYKNIYHDRETGEEKAGSTTLHLGNTNTFKAFYGVLTDLGISKQSTIKSFYHAWGCYNKTTKFSHGHNNVGKNILMIRQVYELVGSGTGMVNDNGKFEKLGKVDYLIYNVPDSKTEIYVRSVPEILNYLFQLIENQDVKGNPFTQAVAVSKKIFKDITLDLT